MERARLGPPQRVHQEEPATPEEHGRGRVRLERGRGVQEERGGEGQGRGDEAGPAAVERRAPQEEEHHDYPAHERRDAVRRPENPDRVGLEHGVAERVLAVDAAIVDEEDVVVEVSQRGLSYLTLKSDHPMAGLGDQKLSNHYP